jgi:glucose-1-phosphate cytidylyltransferase
MNVIILCGGKGTRLAEETDLKPKPMVEIGGKPILWHIMKTYSYYGFNKFILALGYKGEYIKEYFYNMRILSNDFKLSLNPHHQPKILNYSDETNWEITFVDTGENTLKGGRIKRLNKYIRGEDFHLTYGDGLSNLNINELVKFHKKHSALATVTAVHPPSRFGEIKLEGIKVKEFEEKPQMKSGYINGGFFILNRKVMNYLTEDETCDFEFGPLQRIAAKGQLNAFRYDGFWQCMDNIRERDYLNQLVNANKAPWMLWKK